MILVSEESQLSTMGFRRNCGDTDFDWELVRYDFPVIIGRMRISAVCLTRLLSPSLSSKHSLEEREMTRGRMQRQFLNIVISLRFGMK
jgi:hypothetical protein